MLVRIAWWELKGSPVSIEKLRDYLADESVEAFSHVEGLRFKAWISDRATNRWGAVYLFESAEAAAQEMPSRAAEIIGKPPDNKEDFEVEATIEGVFSSPELSRRGLAFGA